MYLPTLLSTDGIEEGGEAEVVEVVGSGSTQGSEVSESNDV